ncbi:4873_t:CDS:2, partial [Funneliformis mosseae]
MASSVIPLTFEDLNEFSAERYNNLLKSKIELGLRLIHKHISLKEDKAMIEKYTEFNNNPALITSAGFVDEKTYPASWLLNENETLTVFEYSRDLHVKRTLDKIIKDPLPFRNICQLIKQYHFEFLLAPCIHARDSLVHFDENKHFIEKTYSDLLASVIQSGERKPGSSYISTLWGAPITYGCQPSSYCWYNPERKKHEAHSKHDGIIDCE